MKIRYMAVMVLSLCALAQSTPKGASPEAQAIASRAFVGGHSMDYLTEMTDKFGPRLLSSDNHMNAAKWAADQFRAMGIKDVRLESFTITQSWKRVAATGRILTPVERPLHLESLGWSPATPDGGVKGEVVLLDEFSADAIKQRASEIRGKVVLLNMKKVYAARDESYKPYIDLEQAPTRLKEAGAAAILTSGNRPSQVLGTTSLGWDGNLSPLPAASIGKEDSDYLMRIAKTQRPTVEFAFSPQVGGATQVPNVIAEIRGSEKPDEWIIIGAHLDSWDFGTGAQDNGAGTAQVLEAARLITSLGKAPKRSIRFALWAGEEEGLLGSRQYVKQHQSELAKCVAVLNTDNGSGEVQGWKVEGRDDLVAAMQPFSDSVLAPFGAGQVSKEITYDTDHGPFMLAGIPAFDLLVDMKAYMEVHHNAGDTLDKVNVRNLNIGAAVVAITADYIANADKPIGPHLDREALGKILKDKDLDEYLHSVGEW
jgi:hypothetical protein